jgi:hypothetical protein
MRLARLRNIERALPARDNPLFDAAWYLEAYPDVLASGYRPYRHYVRHGVLEGRDPNPLFHTDWYLQQYADARGSRLNPLDHYTRIGAARGHDPSPLFDTDWYLEQNPDVRSSGQNPLLHYLRHGAVEGRLPRPPERGGSSGLPRAHDATVVAVDRQVTLAGRAVARLRRTTARSLGDIRGRPGSRCRSDGALHGRGRPAGPGTQRGIPSGRLRV